MSNYSKFKAGVTLFPQNDNAPSESGDMRYNSSTNKVEVYNGTIDPVVTEADTASLSNKTLVSPILSPGTANVAVVTDGSGALTQSATTAAQIGYLDTTTSDVQVQLDSKATSTGVFVDNHVIRADGTANIQSSGVIVDDSDNMTGVTSISTPSLTLGVTASNTIASTSGALRLSAPSNEIIAENSIDLLSNPAGTLVSANFYDIQTIPHKISVSAPNNIGGADLALTLPAASGIIIGGAATQTMSNKTFSDAITATQISTPSNPPASNNKLYFKSDGHLYSLSSAGIEIQVDASALSITPSGTLIQFAGPVAPTGYLFADGSTLSRTSFANLFAAIGTTWGIGDGSTTFNLPDMRGFFPRGASLSEAAARDPDTAARTAVVSGTFTLASGSTNGTSTVTVLDTTNLAVGMTITGTNIPANTVVGSITSSTQFILRNQLNNGAVTATGTTAGLTFTFSKSVTANYVGSVQASTFASHSHGFVTSTTLGGTAVATTTSIIQSAPSGGGGFIWGTASNISNTASIQANGGNETRGINAYVLYCIKT